MESKLKIRMYNNYRKQCYNNSTLPFFYQVTDTSSKIADIYSEIALVLKQLCDCPVTADYLSDAELLCPEKDNDFVIRARVFSVSDKGSSTLITYLANWIESDQASIVLNGVRVNGLSTCSVEIESFSDPLCEADSSSKASTGNSGNSGTGTIAGSTAGGLALIAVVIVALYIYRSWYKRQKSHKRQRRDGIIGYFFVIYV